MALDPRAHLYQINSPYAHQMPLLEWEVLMEASPFCSVSHYSAMVFHQLTEDFPTELHAMLPARVPDWYPIGTSEDDWDEVPPPKGKRIDQIFNLQVHWHLLKQLQGIREYKPHGYPVRVTTPERTLVDGLLEPDWCGGIEKVFRAWSIARDNLNIQGLVDLVDVFNVTLLRQRVGFVMETLGLRHPALDSWPAKAQRGGTSKLIARGPYQAPFDEKWCLSINAPIETLKGSRD